MGDEKIPNRLKVSKARGQGVVVEVWDGRGGHLRSTHPAMTWAELQILGEQHNAPSELWEVDGDAEELLGPEPPQAPGESN